MAFTHPDGDYKPHPMAGEWMKSLEQKAALIRAAGGSRITGGADGEEVVAAWQSNDVDVRQLPPDEHGVLRISIGGGNTPVPLNYCRFRGSHSACVDLLRKALKAMEQGPENN